MGSELRVSRNSLEMVRVNRVQRVYGQANARTWPAHTVRFDIVTNYENIDIILLNIIWLPRL